jgi:hypothetical protein
MSITLKEVLEFGTQWFDTVMSGGSAEAQASFCSIRIRGSMS